MVRDSRIYTGPSMFLLSTFCFQNSSVKIPFERLNALKILTFLTLQFYFMKYKEMT